MANIFRKNRVIQIRYISEVKIKIIVVGGGKVGTALCRSLVEEKHNVVLIEENEAVLKNITKRHDIMGSVGNGANFKILEQADVANCDIFIALTDKDEVNMISAVLAKQMGAKETVVRVRNPEYSNAYFKDKNFLGFSLVVNPELLTARYIANTVDFPNALSVEHFVNGRVMLMEFVISDGSKLCHMSLSQFRKNSSSTNNHHVLDRFGFYRIVEKNHVNTISCNENLISSLQCCIPIKND